MCRKIYVEPPDFSDKMSVTELLGKKCSELFFLWKNNNNIANTIKLGYMSNEFIGSILDLYKTPAYQKLNAYYEQQTIYSALGVERNENRHSAFIAWLLNPSESHVLKELPLRRFLSLIAALADDENKCYYQEEVRTHLITGNYTLKVQDVKTEQSIVALVQDNVADLDFIVERNSAGTFKSDSQNRFDIWLLLQISFNDNNDNEVIWNIPVVMENKIYSREGNATDADRAQTIRYKNAVGVICNSLKLGKHCQPLMVYLTPSGANGPAADSFVHITYQQLLDHVISPASMTAHLQNTTTEAQVMLDGYVRNLSCPSSNDDKDYSILAIAQSENDSLEAIYESQAFQTAFCAHYYNEAKKLLGDDFQSVDDNTLIADFWNGNENLFKVVLYNHFKNDADKVVIVNRIIKDSNRDTTRYWVGLQEGKWINTKGRPASKSEASYLIFKAYCELWAAEHPGQSLGLEALRNAFPGTLNRYYCERYFNHLFYVIDEDLCFDVEGTKYCGMNASPEAGGWDFYLDNNHSLPNVQPDNIRSVKMWRKDDFARLQEKAKEYGIIIKVADK